MVKGGQVPKYTLPNCGYQRDEPHTYTGINLIKILSESILVLIAYLDRTPPSRNNLHPLFSRWHRRAAFATPNTKRYAPS